MTFLTRIIKSLDFFGTLITFRINNDIEYKSLFGGICSILFFLVSSSYIIYESYFFVLRKNVDFIYSKKTIETPFLNLSNIEYRFAFGLQYEKNDSSCVLDTLQYFNYSISLIETYNSKLIKETPIGIKLCEKNDFNNAVDRTFTIRHLNEMYCPILNNLNYSVEGTMMDYYYKYIVLEIWLTEYAILNYKDFKDYIEENPLEMSYYFLDNAIDYENKKNPIPLFLNYLFKAIDINYQKNTEIILSPIEFLNDDNLMIKKTKKFYGSTIDNHVDSFHQINEQNELGQRLLGKLIIKASPIMFSLSRNYQKIPSFIADLSGILEQILFLILSIVNFFERQTIDIKLIKNMIKFKGNKNYNIEHLINVFQRNNINNTFTHIINKQNLNIEKNENLISGRKSVKIVLNDNNNLFKKVKFLKIGNDRNNYEFNLKRKKINEKQKEKSNEIFTNNSNQNLNIHSTEKKLYFESDSITYHKNNTINNYKTDLKLNSDRIKIRNTKNEKIFKGISNCSVLFSKIFSCLNENQKKKKMFISKAEDKIHYYFDVYNYIKKMQEIDLLIYCLFDNEQIQLFDFLSIPPLKLEYNVNDIYNEFNERQITIQKYDKKKIEDLFYSYNIIKKREDYNFENLKLMRLVNAEINFFS